MVNLRGALRGLGVGLATLGAQGIEEQQRVAADRRLLDREMAFSRFQNDQRLAADQIDRTRDIRTNEIAGKERFLQERATMTEITAPARREERIAATAAQAARDAANRDDRNQVPIDEFDREVDGVLHRIHVYRGGRQEDMGPVADQTARSGRDAPPSARRNGRSGNYEEYRDGEWVDTGTPYPVSSNDDDDFLGEEDKPGAAAGAAAGRTVADIARNAARGRQRLSPRAGAPVRVSSVADAARLAPGTRFITPDGRIGTRR